MNRSENRKRWKLWRLKKWNEYYWGLKNEERKERQESWETTTKSKKMTKKSFFIQMSFRVVYKWKHEEVINHKKGRRRNDQEAFYAWVCIHSKIRSTKMLDFYSKAVRDSSSSTDFSFYPVSWFWIFVVYLRFVVEYQRRQRLPIFHILFIFEKEIFLSSKPLYDSLERYVGIWMACQRDHQGNL